MRARGGDDGPSDAAARLVPASALVYVHLGTDPEREPDARLARIAGSLPFVARLRDRIVAAVSPQAFDLERDVRPWLGDEIAYAAVSPTDSVVLAAVADRPKAEALVARIGNLSAAERYRGVRVLVAGPTALAFVGDFLAVGTEAAVRAAVDRDQGDGARLADLPAYRRASAGRPAERSVDAYASAAGVRTVLAPRDGLLGALGALLDRPGLTAAGASLTAESEGLRTHVRLAGGAPRDAAFEPVLLERVPERAAAYLGVRGALRLMRVLGRLGAAQAARAARRCARRRGRHRRRRRPARAALGRAGARGHGRRGGSRGHRRRRARRHAQGPHRGSAADRGGARPAPGPIARRLAVPGTVPAFTPEPIGGIDAFTLRVTPELGPSYAVADGSLVISTAPAGLEPPRGTLAAAPAFEATIGDVPAEADSLIFLDLRQLLALGEETGLTAIPGLATARDDLSRVRAAGAVITEDPAHPSDTTAELFLEIP